MNRAIFAILAAATFLLAAPASADKHFGIIVDTGAKKQTASIDVAADAATWLRWAVFAGGAGVPSDILFTDETTLFRSSSSSSIPNLFTASAGATALVQVEAVDGEGLPTAMSTKAMLRQDSGMGRFSTELLGASQSIGPVFHIPIGSLESGTDLYVAAISADTLVWLRSGSEPFGEPVLIPANTVHRLPITTANTRVELMTDEFRFNPTTNPSQNLLVLKVVNMGGRLAQTYIQPY